MASFQDLGLREPLLAALEDAGIERPTALQAAAIPVLRREGNLVARAGSGSGKTLAYGLGVLDRIQPRADADDDEGEETAEAVCTRVLVLECTFRDHKKSLEDAHAGCHVHLDELLSRASSFENEHLVLMHFSQLYKPREVTALLAERLPPGLAARTLALLPNGPHWPG